MQEPIYCPSFTPCSTNCTAAVGEHQCCWPAGMARGDQSIPGREPSLGGGAPDTRLCFWHFMWPHPFLGSAEQTTKTSPPIPATLETRRVYICHFGTPLFSIFIVYRHSFPWIYSPKVNSCFLSDLKQTLICLGVESTSDFLFIDSNFCVFWELPVRTRVAHQLGLEYPYDVDDFSSIYGRGNWGYEKLSKLKGNN